MTAPGKNRKKLERLNPVEQPIVGATRRSPVLLGAHRGASYLAPENTLAAIKLALEMGVDFVEVDLHLSKDREVVVIHDDALERTTDGRGYVHELTLGELRLLDAGSWFNRKFPERANPRYARERIPTFQEVLDLIKESPARLYAEIKNGPFYLEGFEEKVVSMIESNRMAERVTVVSFDHIAVRWVKELDRDIETGIIFAARPVDPALDARAARASVVIPNWAYATADLIEAAHKAGLKVSVWTVDELDRALELIERGADALVSNNPAAISAARATP